MQVQLEKHTVVFTDFPFAFYALRNGQHWRDLTGDILVLALTQKIEELGDELAEARGVLEALTDENTYGICGRNSKIMDRIHNIMSRSEKILSTLEL